MWVAIRTVYQFGQKEDGTNIFEERIVCFEAENWDAAHAKARKESAEYAAVSDFEVHPEQDGYEQDGEALIDGYELWSKLYESRESLVDFYARKYTQYDYHPPEWVRRGQREERRSSRL
jgi:hypothetical protein